MALSKIKYKGFTFPYNPETTSYSMDRSYIKHKYPELAGNELEDFGPNACIITGSGEFFGSGAYKNWGKLLKEFKKKGVGSVSHPVFTDVKRGLMTSLKAELEPRPNYVKYSFEIVADTAPTINENLNKNKNKGSSNKNRSKNRSSSKSSSDKAGTKEFVHVVKAGECLSVICARYAKKYSTTISWKAIAKYNNMKNPNLIHVGDKIKIYYPT